MAIRRDGAALRQLGTLLDTGTLVGLTDGQLLERFATRTPEAAEAAFAALVQRHGPMVLRVCRGVLFDSHDAQDAFQATFLILVRKARNLWVRDSLGPWLHRVAYRVACSARSEAARRRRHEHRAAERVAAGRDGDGIDLSNEWERVLHEEIARLPGRYRRPVVLCDLEGATHEQAARHLGCPAGTIKSRLARGRQRLRERLMRRGLVPGAGLTMVMLAAEATRTAIPAELMAKTIKAATRLTSWSIAAEVSSASVVAITGGALKAMFMTKLKGVAALSLTLGVLATGAGLYAHQRPGARTEQEATEVARRQGHLRPPGPDPLDTEPFRAHLKAKKDRLVQREAQLKLASAVLARTKRLVERDHVSVGELELVRDNCNVEVCRALLDQTRAEVREAELRLRVAELLGKNFTEAKERLGPRDLPGGREAEE